MLRRYASLAWKRVSQDSGVLPLDLLRRKALMAQSDAHGSRASDAVRLQGKKERELVSSDGQAGKDENALHEAGLTGSQDLKGVLLCFPRHDVP
jgi:hypothetical protein